MDVRLTWTDWDEVGDYIVPNVLSPRDLVSKPDNMDETALHTRPSNQLWSCRDVTSNFVGILSDIEMKWHLKPCIKHNPSIQLRLI